MPVIFTVPVVLHNRVKSGTDSYGNDVFTTTDESIRGVFSPGSSVEQLQGQDVVTTQPIVYLPTGTNASVVDAVTVNGLSYEVDGDPMAWPANPFTGWQPDYSVEVRLKRVNG